MTLNRIIIVLTLAGISCLVPNCSNIVTADNAEKPEEFPFWHHQSDDLTVVNSEGERVTWRSIIGRNVVVQGIGATEYKGLLDGLSRVIIDDTSILVDAAPAFSSGENNRMGRLVEVTGKLARSTRSNPAGAPNERAVQRVTGNVAFYVITNPKVRFIECATRPRLRLFE